MSFSTLSSTDKIGRQLVRRLAATLLLKMEQPRVVLLVGPMKHLDQPRIDGLAVEERLQPAVVFDPAPFAHPQEDDPVDDPPHRDVQLAVVERFVPQTQILGQRLAPRLDLFQERRIDFGRAALLLVRLGKLVERAAQNRLAKRSTRFRPTARRSRCS